MPLTTLTAFCILHSAFIRNSPFVPLVLLVPLVPLTLFSTLPQKPQFNIMYILHQTLIGQGSPTPPPQKAKNGYRTKQTCTNIKKVVATSIGRTTFHYNYKLVKKGLIRLFRCWHCSPRPGLSNRRSPYRLPFLLYTAHWSYLYPR